MSSRHRFSWPGIPDSQNLSTPNSLHFNQLGNQIAWHTQCSVKVRGEQLALKPAHAVTEEEIPLTNREIANIANYKETRRHEKYERLLERAKALQPLPTAVAHPCDESSLGAAVDAARIGLIAPILVGPADKIRA